MHDFGLGAGDMGVVEEAARADLERGAADALSHMVVMVGDFNVQAAGVQVDYDVPRVAPFRPSPGIFRARWTALWQAMTAIFDPDALLRHGRGVHEVSIAPSARFRSGRRMSSSRERRLRSTSPRCTAPASRTTRRSRRSSRCGACGRRQVGRKPARSLVTAGVVPVAAGDAGVVGVRLLGVVRPDGPLPPDTCAEESSGGLSRQTWLWWRRRFPCRDRGMPGRFGSAGRRRRSGCGSRALASRSSTRKASPNLCGVSGHLSGARQSRAWVARERIEPNAFERFGAFGLRVGRCESPMQPTALWTRSSTRAPARELIQVFDGPTTRSPQRHCCATRLSSVGACMLDRCGVSPPPLRRFGSGGPVLRVAGGWTDDSGDDFCAVRGDAPGEAPLGPARLDLRARAEGRRRQHSQLGRRERHATARAQGCGSEGRDVGRPASCPAGHVCERGGKAAGIYLGKEFCGQALGDGPPVAPGVGSGPRAGRAAAPPSSSAWASRPRPSRRRKPWLHSALEAAEASQEIGDFTQSLNHQRTAKYVTEDGTVDMFTQRSGGAQGSHVGGSSFVVALVASLRMLSAAPGAPGLVRP